MPAARDPTSIAHKNFSISEHVPLVVVGAGAAGIAAAVMAARLGLRTMLVDEHPVAPGLLGIDVPWMFGDRMDAAARNPARMVERIVAARPGLQEAFDAGVDVRLGVSVWSAFADGPTSKALAAPMLGLADGEHAWFVGFDRLIVAAGARDLALAFPGWDRPGVMGALGFAAAVGDYNAFSGRRIVVLGAGALGEQTVRRAGAAAVEVAAVIDVAARSPRDFGVPVHSGFRVREVLGATEVEGVSIARPDGSARTQILCDTIVLAIDTVPNVELLDLLGCAMRFAPDAGGYVPVTDAQGRCSRVGIYAAGDCAVVSDEGHGDPRWAAASGRSAAGAAARDAGLAAPVEPTPPEPAAIDRDAWRREWLQAHAGDDATTLPICLCEEVPLGDLLGVRPPRYLAYDAARFAQRDVRSLAADGPVNQDQIKRLTRAGMGLCQGRRCREQVQVLLAMQGNQTSGSVPMPSYRAPLRPLPLSVLAAFEESPEMQANWTAWFGIAAQWLPHWQEVPEGLRYEASWNLGRLE